MRRDCVSDGMMVFVLRCVVELARCVVLLAQVHVSLCVQSDEGHEHDVGQVPNWCIPADRQRHHLGWLGLGRRHAQREHRLRGAQLR